MKYCINCDQKVTPEGYGVGWGILTFLLVISIYGILFAIALVIWRLFCIDKRPMCRSMNYGVKTKGGKVKKIECSE